MKARRLLLWTAVLALLGWVGASQYSRGVRLGFYSVGPGDQELATLRFDGPSWRVEAQPAAAANGESGEAMPAGTPPVRNVILVVGDGLGFNQLTAARAELVGPNGRLFLETLPVATWVTTHSVDNLYTDSAASATALATGFKTVKGMLSQTPEGSPLRTLAESALAGGGRVGLVTSTLILDATPAAFLSHVANRSQWEDIAAQMAASGAELLVSEGYEPKNEERRERMAQILATFEAAGYRHITSWEALQATAAAGPGERTLALLPPESIARGRSPSLAQLTELALRRLGSDESGFFLLVEDEESDTASHYNELARVVAAVADLDEVVRTAVEFARVDGETLVLVTADHETGGFLVYEGPEGGTMRYRYSSEHHTNGPVPLLAFGPGAERFSGVLDNTDVPRLVSALTGWELDDG